MSNGSESLRIAVVCGGASAEASVSRVSGRGVAEALKQRFEHVGLMELDASIAGRLAAGYDVVFPVLHGPLGEDGAFQGLLEVLELPYVGCGVQASACAMDKIVAKQLFRAYGLPIARDAIVHRGRTAGEDARRALRELGNEVVVKPARQGSALGVAFADSEANLLAALERAFAYDERVLIEERIRGREITVGVLQRKAIEALPVIEIRTPSNTWYDYDHRYTPGWSEHILPAPLPPATYQRTQEVACAAHRALGCRDLSRADFVVTAEGTPVLLEVNTMPGMTPTSLYPDAALAAGISFPELAALLVEQAWQRKPHH